VPNRREGLSLLIIAIGAVIGFPLLTGLALADASSAYSTMYISLLPLSTALFGVWRAAERPKRMFWVYSATGAFCVAGYAIIAQGAHGPLSSDIYMIGAILICGWAYAEGAVVSRTLGGWQVICWALLFSLLVTAPLSWLTLPTDLAAVPGAAWIGLGYVTVFSMLVGFVFWYRGLAKGGIAGVGQLQLLQPFFALVIAALILDETVSIGMGVTALAVVACVAGAKRHA
jgi:drug/metabolite transporter (DMT)-like permease